jgi:hypothetical protein
VPWRHNLKLCFIKFHLKLHTNKIIYQFKLSGPSGPGSIPNQGARLKINLFRFLPFSGNALFKNRNYFFLKHSTVVPPLPARLRLMLKNYGLNHKHRQMKDCQVGDPGALRYPRNISTNQNRISCLGRIKLHACTLQCLPRLFSEKIFLD